MEVRPAGSEVRASEVQSLNAMLLMAVTLLMSIDTSELQNLLSKLGKYLTPDELKLAVEKIDTDGSGVIEYEEFVAWYDAGGAEMGSFTANTEDDRKQREREEKKAAKARAKAQKQEERAKKLEEKAKKRAQKQ